MKVKTMKLKSLTAKLAALLLAFGCAGGAWGATLTVGSSGADYTTLKSAFAAVGDGDTVQLIEDISYSSSNGWNDKLVVDGKRVTLDLNGHNVTYTRSASPDGSMFYLKNGAELLIDGTGTIVLTPITTTHTTFKCVEMSGNTGLKATLGANVTVYAECFGNVEYNTNNAETGSTFDIYGTIIGNNSSYDNILFSCSSGIKNFTVNILGGTLEIPRFSNQHINIQASTETTFTLNMASGKIYCTQTNFNAVKFNLHAAVKSTFNITGGYFGSNAPKQGTDPTRGFSLPAGYGFYPASGVDYCPYQVGVCEAKIGNVCYPSVSAAIEAATASNYVALNVDYSDVVTIPAGKTVNFNGGSYTFSGSFTVNGTLKIVGGTYTFNPAAELLGSGCSVTDNGDDTWTVIQSVAQVGETTYSTFADALAAANALGTATIKFLADVDLGSSSINIAAGKNITLDLNGNNVTCSASDQFLVKSGATLILCDTSDGASGTLTHSGQYDLSDNSGTVEILSGTYNVVNYGVAYNNGSAVLNIKGGTVNSARRAYYKGVTTISGGTIKGTISDVATTVITGGVFNNDPTAYVDADCQVLTDKPSAGYWTVGAPQPVAQIGSAGYESLAAAILAAQDGDTIEILDGTWGAAAVGEMTTSEKGSVRAKSLTIQAAEGASPKFTADVSLGYDDNHTANATMTVKGLAFENAQLSLVNYVQATVEDCSFTGSGASAALYVGDSCDKTHLTSGDYSADQVTISGCTFDGTASGVPAIRVRNSGNVTITGNTVANAAHNGILLESNSSVANTSAKTVVVQNNAITEWNVGDVNDGGRGIRADLGGLAAGSTVTVSGNVLRKDPVGLDTPDFMKITGAGSATVDLSGNDWNDMLLSEVLGNSAVYTCNAEATTLTSVITTKKEPVAQIVTDNGATTNKYSSLAAAVAAVPTDGTATTITMTANSAETSTITIAATKNVVLDLNGKTVSYTTDAKSVYFLTNKGTLTVKDTSTNADGQILLTAQPDTGYSVECVTVYNLGGTLTLESGTIKNATAGGLAYAVNNSSNAWGQNDDKVSTFNMTGGTVSAPSGDAALRVYQNCAAHVAPVSKNYVNISGGTIVDTGIFVDTVLYTDSGIQEGFADSIDTEINISGGTVNGLVDMKIRHKNNTKLNITGGDFTNAKLWVRKVAAEYKGDEPTEPMVSISGGKFAFVTGKAFGLAYDCGATSWTSYAKPYEVTGGVFNVDLNNYSGIVFEEGKTGVANTDPETSAVYPYTVGVEVIPVAQIGDDKYGSLADAVAAIPADGDEVTIVVLRDHTIATPATKPLVVSAAGQNVKLDLAGHTVTVENYDNSNGFKLDVKGTFTLCDSDESSSGKLNVRGVNNYGTLNITGGELYSSIWAIQNKNNVVLNISGGKVTAAGSWGVYSDEGVATITMSGGLMTAYYGGIYATSAGSVVNITDGHIVASTSNEKDPAVFLGYDGNKATMTMSGGLLEGCYGVSIYAPYTGSDKTVFTMTGGTLRASGEAAINTNGTRKENIEINISGGRVENLGEESAIYNPNAGAVINVSGNVVIAGPTGIALKGGTLNISGGEIIGTGVFKAPAAVNSGTTSTGDAVYVEDTYGPGDYNVNYAPTVNITGGTLSSVNGYAAQYFTEQTSVSTYKANGSINITGDAVMTSPKPTTIVATTVIPNKVIASAGYFSSEVPASYCAANRLCTTKPTANGMYQVVPAATVTYTGTGTAPEGVTDFALPDPDSFTYPSGDRAEIKLSLPTYTSEDYTFGGWTYTVDDKTVNIGTTFPAGTTGDKALVGTWTKAAKIEVVTDSTKPTEKVEVKVTEDWVKDNVTKAGAVATSAEIKESLEQTKANGLTGLENYVLGLNGKDPNAKLKVDSTQSDSETSMPVVNTVKQTVDTGFTVKYSLDKVNESGTVTEAGQKQETSDLDLNLAAATSDSNSAYFKMTATITKKEGNTETTVKSVPSENTIGVMKVESQSKTTVIGVPWTSLSDDGSISVADIVRTSTLSEGDQIQVYDTVANGYRSWTLDDKGAWVADEVIGGGTSTEQAQTVKIDRGKGVLLTRTGDKSKPIYLVGEASTNTVSTTLEKATDSNTPAWNLVASPSVEAKTIEQVVASTDDTIIVPTDSAPRNYTYKDGKWGYSGLSTETITNKLGIIIVRPVRVTGDTQIPAGRGFWYLNKDASDNEKKINW